MAWFTFRSMTRSVAAVVSLLLVVGAGGWASAPVRAADPTVQSLSCAWGGIGNYSLVYTLTMSGPVADLTTVRFSTDHPEILGAPQGLIYDDYIQPGASSLIDQIYPDEIAYPDQPTEVTLTATVGAAAASCAATVATSGPPPDVLASFTCEPSIVDALDCTVDLTAPSPFLSVIAILSTDHPEILPYLDDSSGFAHWNFLYGAYQGGQAYNNTSAIRPARDTTVTVFVSIPGSNTLSQSFFVPGIPPTETATPTVTGTPPTSTPTATPRPTRTPAPTRTATPTDRARIRVVHTQSGTRGGHTSKITICLDRAAPAGGQTVRLSSSPIGLFLLPAEITIPAALGCLSIPVQIADTDQVTVVTITASANGSFGQGTTTVYPSRPAIHTQTVSRASGQSKVTVCQLGAAPAGGSTVGLISDHTALFPVPESISIPEGRACLSLVVDVGDTESPTNVQISADFGGTAKTAQTLVRRIGSMSPADELIPATAAPTVTKTVVVIETETAAPIATATATEAPYPTTTEVPIGSPDSGD